jgi:2-polyprenyl-3-methyl-5-hydroxy-6-metoxy-1,4-benzoquinol methylase
MKPLAEITADFDAIAGALSRTPARRRLTDAEGWLALQIPNGARTGMDIGCGDGVFTRAMAERGLHVAGIDVSSRMIALARERTPPALGAQYLVADVIAPSFHAAPVDVVACINVVHHFALAAALARLTAFVAPGGTLLIQDVVTRRGLRYLPINIVGAVQRRVLGVVGRSSSKELAQCYERHGQDERYLTPREAEAQYAELLPGARVHQHVEWRYSAVWSRP